MSGPHARSALLLSGSPGDTRRYRVTHAAEALRLEGWRVRRAAMETRWDPEDVRPGELLLLHRVPWSEAVATVLRKASRQGAMVLYDTDDLIFQDAAAERLRRLGEGDADAGARPNQGGATPFSGRSGGGSGGGGPDAATHGRGETVGSTHGAPGASFGLFAPPASYRRTLLACDGAWVTTEPLRQAIEALGRPAFVVRNALNLELLRLSSRAWQAREARMALAARAAPNAGSEPRGARPIVVGYASGTATHDRDFQACAPSLRALMRTDARIRLRIIGPLQLDDAWAELAPRVERVDYMPWSQLPEALAALDINLAPLEQDDPFSAAKSELKWFEAGAVGVPTIATPTPAFQTAIEDGQSGLLAGDEEGWRTALERLLDDGTLRQRVGRAARAAVIDGYVSDLRGATMAAACAALPKASVTAEPEEDRAAQWAVRICDGGQDTVLARALRDAVRRAPDLRRQRSTSASSDCEVWEGAGAITVAVGTAGIQRSDGMDRHGTDRPALLLLDRVPGLSRHPMGAERILAQRAASSGTPTVALGPWLATRLAEQGVPIAAVVPPPIDPRRFAPGLPQAQRERTVAVDLAATADLSSRTLCVAALRAVGAAEPDAELLVFASGPVEEPWVASTREALPDGRWLGVLAPQQRASLLRDLAVLIAPPTLGPRGSAWEAMACGCVVVAPALAAVEAEHDEPRVLAPAQPDALGARAAELLRDAPERERRAVGAMDRMERWTQGRTQGVLAEAVAEAVANAARRTADAGAADDARAVHDRRGAPDRRSVRERRHADDVGAQHGAAADAPPAAGGAGLRTEVVLDAFQALSDGPGPLLAPGRRLSQSLRCRFGGLSAVELQLAPSPEPRTGVLTLTLHAGVPPAPEVAAADRPASLRSVELPLPDLDAQDRARMSFPPLRGSAGRIYHLSWSWRPDADGPDGQRPPAPLVVQVDAFSHGRTYMDNEITTAWTPAFATWCRPRAVAPLPPGAAAPAGHMVDRLRELSWRTGEDAEALRQLEAALPNRLLRRLMRLGQPLPPLQERPWPADASAWVKLWGILRHYGPLALLRELLSFARWLRLSDNERATVSRRG